MLPSYAVRAAGAAARSRCEVRGRCCPVTLRVTPHTARGGRCWVALRAARAYIVGRAIGALHAAESEPRCLSGQCPCEQQQQRFKVS
eukprot:314832-Chlamydomonas_euryale.AAC.1